VCSSDLGYQYGGFGPYGTQHQIVLRENGTTYTQFGMAGNMHLIGSGNATGDFRAPIFYDSNNTAYYTDPNGMSSMYGVAIRGDASQFDTSNQIFFWGTGNSTTSAIGFKNNGGNFANPTGNGDGYNTYFTMDTVGRGWVFRRGTGGTNFTSAFTAGWILNNGIAQFNNSTRSPIFYDSNNTGFYTDPNGTSRHATTITDTTYFGSDTNKGRASGFGTWSNSFHKTAYVSYDWNANYDTYSNHGIASTDINGNFTDSMSLNSFNDINLRLDANNNNGNSYVRIHDNSTGNGQNVAYIGRESNNAIAYFYNRVYGAIFYDLNNDGYYGDFASTSRMNAITLNTLTMVTTGVIRRNDATSTYTQFNTTAQWRVVISGNENFRVNASETYSRVVIRSASDIVAFYSDERLKTKKGSIDNALQKILQLDGFYYTTNDLAKSVGYKEEGLQVGISAQQVQNILPEVVTLAPFDSTYDDNGNLYSISGENYLTVKYEKMVPLIIEGIKDQQKIVNWNNIEVKKLKNIVSEQQKQIDELKEMIKSLMK
jgi:hypothetical protein